MIDFMTRQVLESLFFPPGIIIVIGILVLITTNMRPKIMEKLLFLAVMLLWMTSTPAVSFWLLDSLQNRYPTLQQPPADADVIVVLGGGSYDGLNEYGRTAMLDATALERALYGGYLAKTHQLPIITTGGQREGEMQSHAAVMAMFLQQDLGIAQVLRDDESLTTFQNAEEVKGLMARIGATRPLVVSQGWHLPRAMESFEYLGVNALAAPTAKQSAGVLETGWLAWMPRADSLERTRVALHEWLGIVYYRIKLFRD